MRTTSADQLADEQLFTLFREQIDRDDDLLRDLVALRRELGLSQSELAHLMETDQGYLSRLENGALNPRVRTLREYAVALGVEIHHTLRPFVPAPIDSGEDVEFLDDPNPSVAAHITATLLQEGALSWRS